MAKGLFGAQVFILSHLRRAPFIKPLWDEFERMLASRDQALRKRDAAFLDRDVALVERNAARVERDVARAERDATLAGDGAKSQTATPEHQVIEGGVSISTSAWMERVFALAKPYVSEGVLEAPVCIAPTLGNALANGRWFDNEPALLATTLEALERDQLPIPTPANREGYGHDDHAAYWLSGYHDYVKVRTAAERLKTDPNRVLDFGGSTGRVYRHFYAQGWAKEVYVCDFKQVTIEWCKLNFPADIRVCLNTFLPSLPFPDEFFDLITAFSVFTHIDEFEEAWLLELSRILRPGGLAYLTIHDENTWSSGALADTISQSSQASAIDPNASMPFERQAFKFRRDSHYACNVFHSSRYIRKYWGRYFQIESIEPFGHHAQAVVLARKPILPPGDRLGQETVVPEEQSDLAVAAAIWNLAEEPLEEVNRRIHDGVPLDKLAERADAYVNNIMHLFPHASLPSDASILEIGSGVGYIMEAMDRYARSNNLGIKQIVGLDIAEHMIEKAKSRVGEKSNFAFVHYDGIDVPLADGSFDFIYSVASLQHVPKPYVYNLFFEIRRLLAETGHAVIQLLNFKGPTSETWRDEIRQQVHRSPGHWHHCYTVEELEFAVRASGFSHVDIREVGGLTWLLARPVTPPL